MLQLKTYKNFLYNKHKVVCFTVLWDNPLPTPPPLHPNT